MLLESRSSFEALDDLLTFQKAVESHYDDGGVAERCLHVTPVEFVDGFLCRHPQHIQSREYLLASKGMGNPDKRFKVKPEWMEMPT
ncbi:MAG: hypothetical protein NT013_09225 [Planctomycetia bacterium]|nr:hypothetical protein [Planctomycetia bacterium]